ncbi:hypothetical protein [Actinomyces succiniciruminis]|uniref:AbiEi antitoxin C-terminal domain-containing protein n=1 Tax=Actinomyces succiniciruminis TaxID=1522002 RepID=A0A1L7RRC7_9ACTO|nr:hypothetical protein [Actinomyces succiniciruminis]CED92272.1 Hypothetical protein AAM4_2440 [Actinomyces succiniciruminis]
MPTAPSTPPAPSSSPEPRVDFAPGARTGAVPARAVLAHLMHGPVEPILDALPLQELTLLRCHGLDERVLVDVLGQAVPVDLLGNPAARAAALAPRLPANRVVAGRTALWVHTGGPVPAGPELVRAAPPADVVALEGVVCLGLTRAVVDLARTAPPAVAVDAVLRARRAGLTRRDLEPALLARRGGGMRGLRRARRLIDELYAPIGPDGVQASA